MQDQLQQYVQQRAQPMAQPAQSSEQMRQQQWNAYYAQHQAWQQARQQASSSTDGVEVTGERSLAERDAELRKSALDLDEPASKRVKAEHEAEPAAAASSSAAPQLDSVRGLKELMTDMPGRVEQVALDWCKEQQLTAVSLVAEAELDDIFIGAMPIPQSGVLAVVLRKRLAKMRAS